MPEPKTILIIDDEPNFVDALRGTLNLRGYRTLTAGDGREGLEILSQNSPDLILLDISMPRMSGIEFCNKISDSKGNPKVPTIVLSAREELRGVFDNTGVRGFLTKPVRFEEMFKKIEDVIRSGAAIAETPPKKKAPGTTRALLVDNDDDFAAETETALKAAGYAVTRFRSGIEALGSAVGARPDIVLIKLGLPDMGGDDVAYELRLMDRAANVPLILYTRNYDTLDHLITQNLCKKIGIKDILSLDEPKTLLREAEALLAQA